MTYTHWTENATYVSGPNLGGLLGENDQGTLLVPSRTRVDWWDRRFNPRNPTHWRYWLRSRLTGRIAMLEAE